MAARRSTNMRRSGQPDRATSSGQPRYQATHCAAVRWNLAYDTVFVPREGLCQFS